MKDIQFKYSKPFDIFEIDNFLEKDLYLGLRDNFPIMKNNHLITSLVNYKNGKYAFDTKSDIYKQELQNNIYVKRLHNLIFTKKFFYFFYKNLYFKFLKSRCSSLKHLIKLLRFPKIVNSIDKNNIFHYLSIFTNMRIELQYSLIKNMGYIVPHTDSGEKLLSLMIYFPDYEGMDSKIYSKEINYGTSFWDSNEKNFGNNHQEGSLRDIFKKKNKIFVKPDFTGNKLIGFIKNPYSWHSVEPIDVHENYVRKTININIYF
jgi:hypothetical protein